MRFCIPTPPSFFFSVPEPVVKQYIPAKGGEKAPTHVYRPRENFVCGSELWVASSAVFGNMLPRFPLAIHGPIVEHLSFH
jgi:hypothetical protein